MANPPPSYPYYNPSWNYQYYNVHPSDSIAASSRLVYQLPPGADADLQLQNLDLTSVSSQNDLPSNPSPMPSTTDESANATIESCEKRLKNIANELKNFKKELKKALNCTVNLAKSRGINLTTGIYFDPTRLRDHLLIDVQFYDKAIAAVDLVAMFKLSKHFVEEQFSINFVRKLYKSVLVAIYGKENLGHYSAAKNPHGGNTSVSSAVFNGIESLILQGFGIPANKSSHSAAQTICVLNVKNTMSRTNAYLFSNNRRNNGDLQIKKEKTPKRKGATSKSASKKRKSGANESNNEDVEEIVVLGDGNEKTPKRKPTQKYAKKESRNGFDESADNGDARAESGISALDGEPGEEE